MQMLFGTAGNLYQDNFQGQTGGTSRSIMVCRKIRLSKTQVLIGSSVLALVVLALLHVIPTQYVLFRISGSTSSLIRWISPHVPPATEQEVLRQIQKYNQQLPNSTEVSVVTAYFNLGLIKARTPELYMKWMTIFRWLDNPLVVFADTEETATHFRHLRAHYPPSRTSIHLLQRETLWSFQLADEIQTIFQQPGYPRHKPNTVDPLYSCAMHAKFELMEKVVREHLYQTRFVAWLDIGLFRMQVNRNVIIHLTVPTDFLRTHVGYSQVFPFQTTTVKDIIGKNKVWVGGASFLATPEVAYVYCREYRRAVRKLLDMKWMSTDQQVIYSMFQPGFDFTPRVQIQTYTTYPASPWFSMGYLMKLAP